MNRNILITGGAGFIGSHVVNHFVDKYTNYNIIVLDSLTYASNYKNITGLNSYNDEIYVFGISNLSFINADITNSVEIDKVFKKYNITHVIHLAAESHVDNSIESPNIFVTTNVNGTVNLLNSALKYWKKDNYKNHRFHHVSTDEVYGTLKLSDETFTEDTPYSPRSPYSASKASSDHFVRVYHETYGLPITISNCSNNYGPHQHIEKLIPKVINNLINKKNIPVYGTGENIRDWLYVSDHVNAIDLIMNKGVIGETYNVGGDNEMSNLTIIGKIGLSLNLTGSDVRLKFIEDRKGHDFRYGVNSTKLKDLGWAPEISFENGIKETIKYYLNEY